MGTSGKVAATLAAVSMLAAFPTGAIAMSSAEKLRRLDIMLMVTGLRCRTTADNFQADYGRFTTNHITELNAASDQLKRELVGRPGGPVRALDRLSVVMANTYGQGHPWLGCSELKQVARNLAQARGSAPLIAAADQLLGESGNSQIVVSRR